MADLTKPKKKQRVLIHEKAVQEIAKIVLDEKLQVGDKLITERELSERLGISRPSVREALQVLSAGGLIETRRGSGSYLATGPEGWQVLLSRRIAEDSVLDEMIYLIEARMLLESHGFCEVAKFITEAGMNQLYRMEAEDFTSLLETADEERTYGYHGTQFEHTIITMQPNHIFTEMHRSVIDKWEHYKREYNLVAMPTLRRHQEHLAVLNAISERVPSRIEKCVMSHLNATYENLLLMKNDLSK